MKKRSPTVHCTKEVSAINIQKGETITVWLQASNTERIQVEIRIGFDGKPEIFTDSNMMLNVKSFEHWKAIYDDY